MELNTVLDLLEKARDPKACKTLRAHGVTGPCLGVSYAELGKLARMLGTNDLLAAELWGTGGHDARVLATKISGSELQPEKLLGWIEMSEDYILADAVAVAAARCADSVELARRWVGGSSEWQAAAGWAVYTVLVLDDRVNVELMSKLLQRIRSTIKGAKNRVRHNMNGTLIAIGGAIPLLHDEAVSVAKEVGPLEVDHGETHCKTPDAVTYIKRMVKHRKKLLALSR